ncbi:MAG TPA: hypothetical protein VNP93_01825 [Gaiellaceae bacterium]|nr:hypothetical protein [Gaiellaceae bacterium]
MSALPTISVIGDTHKAQSEAHDTTEQIVRDATAFASEHEIGLPAPAVMPTNADVGELFLFAYYTAAADELRDLADELQRWLPVLGEMPTNCALQAAAT